MNHRWETDGNVLGQKYQRCIKCNMDRYWLYGDMQCWEYLDLQSELASQRTTLHRPNCDPNRGKTQGFYQDGRFIY